MRLPIESIPDEGLRLEVPEMGPWAVEAAGAGLEGAVDALEGYLQLTRFEETVRVRGDLLARYSRLCDRCSEEGEGELGGPLDLSYVPSRELGSGAVDLKSDELDVGFYDGGALDLAAVVAEHFALILPYRLTCDAPGYALADGRPCTWEPPSESEEKETVDPRFSALAGLKLDN